MNKQVRISTYAESFLKDEAEASHRRVLGDQIDALIDELKDWRMGGRAVTVEESKDTYDPIRDTERPNTGADRYNSGKTPKQLFTPEEIKELNKLKESSPTAKDVEIYLRSKGLENSSIAPVLRSFDTPELTQEYINEATRPLAEKLEQDKGEIK